MKPRITLITLGTDDLERSLSIYRDGLGLASEGIIARNFECGAVAFSRSMAPGARAVAEGEHRLRTRVCQSSSAVMRSVKSCTPTEGLVLLGAATGGSVAVGAWAVTVA